jgi:preprotein translocase subunit SecG
MYSPGKIVKGRKPHQNFFIGNGKKNAPEEAMPKVTIWLLALFICLLILGLNTGEIASILNSGTSICLSCIGVG